MIIINIFEPPPPLVIRIIISENVDNNYYGWPLIKKILHLLQNNHNQHSYLVCTLTLHLNWRCKGYLICMVSVAKIRPLLHISLNIKF